MYRALCTFWAEWTLQRNILLSFIKRLFLCAVHFEGYFSGVKVARAWGWPLISIFRRG